MLGVGVGERTPHPGQDLSLNVTCQSPEDGVGGREDTRPCPGPLPMGVGWRLTELVWVPLLGVTTLNNRTVVEFE